MVATFYGTDIDDSVSTSGNYDLFYGGRGKDTLKSSVAGPNYREGGQGNDCLYALCTSSAYADFYGDDGNDLIQPGNASLRKAFTVADFKHKNNRPAHFD